MARKKNKDGYVMKSEVQLVIQNYIRNIQMNDYSSDSGIPQLYRVMDMIGEMPIKEDFKDERECANCGRFNKETYGCGKYVDDCMIDGDAYSNWIPKNNIKEDF